MSQTETRATGAETARQAPPQTAPAGQQIATAEVAPRPALAPNVQLVGEMQGSGYQDRQWLIQRDGQFIQVTELLYCLATHADGRHTLAEIAAAMTEATEWLVGADDVRRLVQTKLMPLGLIAAPSGALPSGALQGAAHAGPSPSPSPLGLMMRAKVIGPHIIGPIAALLQWLYAPLVLIPLLILVVLAHGWLYLVHGVAGGILDAFYAPGLVLLVLAILLVSSVFHEFGHAAALSYGGGKVRGMGVGLYLIYPAFYTDVTDGYRLNRWARLRTDLGGVYFHLIVALAIIALYLVSGQEYLLLAVVLIDLEILYQFVPFARLDGYWALADLTGVPDFFSMMRPFSASLAPLPGWSGGKLPPLRPWVKAVFAAYMLVTLPLLAATFLILIVKLPTLATISWQGLLRQTDVFAAARGTHDVLGMVAAAVQMLLVSVPMVGTVLLLYAVGRGPLHAVWAWSRPTPPRRLGGALGTAGALALVGFLWAPQLPFAARQDLQAGAAIDGIPCVPGEMLAYHSHVALTLYQRGRPVPLPANVGIPTSAAITRQGRSACLYWLHTHQADHALGIVHVESPIRRAYTLGQFFDIWHYTALWDVQGGRGAAVDGAFVEALRRARPGAIRVYVDGASVGAGYRGVALTAHRLITVELGRPLRPPAAHVAFPPGE